MIMVMNAFLMTDVFVRTQTIYSPCDLPTWCLSEREILTSLLGSTQIYFSLAIIQDALSSS